MGYLLEARRGWLILPLVIGFALLQASVVEAADVTPQVTVTGLTQVSSNRVGRTVFEYTYRITATNSGEAVTGVIGTVTSTTPATTISQPTVTLGDVASNSAVTSAGTFTLRQDRRTPFDPSVLNWTFEGAPSIGKQVTFNQPLPPDPGPFFAQLPAATDGTPILIQVGDVAIGLSEQPPGPVDALLACTGWIGDCVSPADDRALDDCARSAPQCSTATPWQEVTCCPVTCFSQYQALRVAGVSDLNAYDQVYLIGACFPGLVPAE